jgi:hypothetical protein
VGCLLLGMLVAAFPLTGRQVMGLDDHLERPHGEKIAAKGVSRESVRSSRSHFVKASDLRWLSVMLLGPIPWVDSSGRIPGT